MSLSVEFEARIAHAFNRVVVGVGRAHGDFFTFSSEVLGAFNTDTSLDGGIISFIFITFGDDVALDAVAIIVTVVSEVALTSNTVVGFVSSASSAGIEDPVIAFITVTLTVSQVSVDSAILVVGAASVDDSVTSITDTTVGILVKVRVERTSLGSLTFTVVDGHSVGTDALSVDVSSSDGALSLAHAIDSSVARFAETTVAVAVVVLSRVAVGADSSDSDVSGLADTGVGDGRVELIDAFAGSGVAGLGVFIVGL